MTNVVREIEKDAAEKAAVKVQQNIAVEMIKMGLTPQQIAQATKLSLEQIDALRSRPAQ